MKLLAIETSTEACSVALSIDGAMMERFEIAPRRHGELLLPWIDALLADAGMAKSALDAIAVGRGPGAFTGVRLGIAIAQGIAFALDRPVVPVSTLAALALCGDPPPGTPVLAAIDARMGEVYLAGYLIDADGLPQPLIAEQLLAPGMVEPTMLDAALRAAGVPGARSGQARSLDRIPAADANRSSGPTACWHAVGSGLACEGGILATRLASRLQQHDAAALPRAVAVARLAAAEFTADRAVAPEQVEPAYLRDKVAQTLAERGKA